MQWYWVFVLAVIGNMLPVPFILYFLEKVRQFLSRFEVFDRFFSWLYGRSQRRGAIIEKYKRIGLTLFVSVPLPVTGAWTGSLLAVIFGLPRRWSMLAIFIGVFIAGAIVTTLSLLGWWGAAIAGVVLLSLAAYSFFRA